MIAKRTIFLLALFLIILSINASKAYGAVNQWNKSITFHLVNESFRDVDASLLKIKETGANYIALSPGWVTPSVLATNVDRKVRTPADSLVIYTINKAHSLGIKVLLKPHLDVAGGRWRANINPTNKAAFFTNYKRMILNYAVLAENTDTETLCIGSELFKLTTNPANDIYWRDIIGDIRKVYSGKLTYNANASSPSFEEINLPFWDDLDYVGLSMYRKVSTTKDSDITDMKNNWEKIERDFVLPNYKRIGKPIMFTEIGYRSVEGAGLDPGVFDTPLPVNLKQQADLYKAFFEFWQDKSYIIGVNFWDWKPESRVSITSLTDYTPQGKPALEILKYYFTLGTENAPVEITLPIIDPPVIITPAVPDTTESSSSQPVATYEVLVDSPKVNSTVSGEKKLKILIKNLNVNTYDAFYKVDSKDEIKMDTSGKFKQAKIDFDRWTWNSNGPYSVLITVKNKNGDLIATKTIVLFVKH